MPDSEGRSPAEAERHDSPEAHADRLRLEIEYELAEYGPRSLAAVIATILKEGTPDSSHTKLAPVFRRIENGDE